MTHHRAAALVVVVMGVSGSGKTMVGARLAAMMGWTFADADDFHSSANLAKMRAHEPLTDADREPWLRSIGSWIDGQAGIGVPVVIACSALKRRYRDLLRRGRPQVRLVYLAADPALIAARVGRRRGHFFPADLVTSQFADLERPAADEEAITVAAAAPLETVIAEICAALDRRPPRARPPR